MRSIFVKILSFVAVALAAFSPSVAFATGTVTLDNHTVGTQSTSNGTNTLPDFTVGTLQSGLIIVHLSNNDGTISLVKDNGTSMTQGQDVTNDNGFHFSTYYLLTPSSGVNSITYNFTIAADNNWYSIKSYQCADAPNEFHGVGTGLAGSGGTTYNFTFTTVGDWIDGFGHAGGLLSSPPWSSSFTIINDDFTGNIEGFHGDGAISGSTVFSFAAKFNATAGAVGFPPISGTCPTIAVSSISGDDDWWFMEFFGWLF